MSILFYSSLVLFLLLCVLLTTIILLQESKTMGLGASFGGDAGSSLFGTSTADVLKTITAWMIGFFMVGSVVLSTWSSIDSKKAATAVEKNVESVKP